MKVGIIGAGVVGLTIACQFEKNSIPFLIFQRKKTCVTCTGKFMGEAFQIQRDRFITQQDIDEEQKFDLLIIAVKRYDSYSASKICASFLGKQGVVLSLQNGVDVKNEYFPFPNQVFHAPIFISANQDDCCFNINSIPKIVLDEKKLNPYGALFEKAGIKVIATKKPNESVVRKMIFVSSFSGICTLFNIDVAELKHNPAYLDLYKKALSEAASVFKKERITFEGNLISEFTDMLELLPDNFKPSMTLDFFSGRRTELNWLSGAIRKLGEKHNIKTPIHNRIFKGLEAH